MFDLFKEISQSLSNNRVRTVLTGIAVVWGIFMLIVLLGMSRGVLNNFESTNWAKTSNRISVYGGSTSLPYKGYPKGRYVQPDTDDFDYLEAKNPDYVEGVSSYTHLGNTVFSTSKDYVSSNPQGVYPQEEKRDGIEVTLGRFINDADINERRKSIVMEKKAAKNLFGDPANAIGKRVNGMGLSWTVVGIYEHDWRDDMYIPFTTASLLKGNKKQVNNLQVEIKNVNTLEDGNLAEAAVRRSMGKKHDISPEDNGGFYYYNRFTNYLSNKNAFNILTLSVWIIGIFTLLSGIVGVSNIMFVSVKERTHEIGIRRAIGAKPRHILIQIITESVVITTLFGYIGIVLGMCVTQAISYFTADSDFLKNPTVSFQIAFEVTAFLIIAGALAGLFPAFKATKVKPVEALRDE